MTLSEKQTLDILSSIESVRPWPPALKRWVAARTNIFVFMLCALGGIVAVFLLSFVLGFLVEILKLVGMFTVYLSVVTFYILQGILAPSKE